LCIPPLARDAKIPIKQREEKIMKDVFNVLIKAGKYSGVI
jgi:hypothetical protein